MKNLRHLSICSILFLAGTLKGAEFSPVQVFSMDVDPKTKKTNTHVNLNAFAPADPKVERETALEKLKKAIVDKSQTDDTVYERFNLWLESWQATSLEPANFQPLEGLMAKNRDPYLAPLLKGRYSRGVTILKWLGSGGVRAMRIV